MRDTAEQVERDIAAALRHYAVSLARQDLLYYVQASCSDYSTAPCHAEICAKLQDFSEAVERGESPRLAIFLPPRAGKSFIAAERFPAWFLGRNPSKRIIATSYGYELASKFTIRARDLAQTEYHRTIFKNMALSDSVQRADQWETAQAGGYYGVGVGGALTGLGADILIIDDPVKNWADALSEAKRRAVWEWYTTTAYTRLMPGGGVLLIQTRWHPDDLGGRILEQGGYDVVTYPAITEAGESYDPARWPIERLTEIRDTIGETAWRCLYQQEPTAAEGQIFKRSLISTHIEAPDPERVCISVDATFKGSETSDYVSIQAWGEHKKSFYLLDNYTARMGFSDTLRAVDRMATDLSKHRPTIVIEDKANGSAIIETMRGKWSRVVPVDPKGGKVARAQAIVPLFEARRISVPESAPWVDRFINELADFPAAKHDDQVDAMTQALTYLDTAGHQNKIANFNFI